MVLAWDEVPPWDGSKGPCEASRDWAGTLRDLTSSASRVHGLRLAAGTGSAGGGSGGSGDTDWLCEFDLTKIAAQEPLREVTPQSFFRSSSRGETTTHALREPSLSGGAAALQRQPVSAQEDPQPYMAKALESALDVRRRAVGLLRITRNLSRRRLQDAWRVWMLAHSQGGHVENVSDGAGQPARRLLLAGALRRWRMRTSFSGLEPLQVDDFERQVADHAPSRHSSKSLHQQAQVFAISSPDSQDASHRSRMQGLNKPEVNARSKVDCKLHTERIAMLLARKRLGLMLQSWSCWIASVAEQIDEKQEFHHGEQNQHKSQRGLLSAVRDWFSITKRLRSRRRLYFWAYRLCIKHLVSQPFSSWHSFTTQRKHLKDPIQRSQHAVFDHHGESFSCEAPQRNMDDRAVRSPQLNHPPALSAWGCNSLQAASPTNSEGEQWPETLESHAAALKRPCSGVLRATRALASSNACAPACPDLNCSRGRHCEEVTFAVPGSDESSRVSAPVHGPQTFELASCKSRQDLPASQSPSRASSLWQSPVKELAALAHCDPAILDPRWWDAAAEALCRDVGGSPISPAPSGRISRHHGQHSGFVEVPSDRQICFDSEASTEAALRSGSFHSDSFKCWSPRRQPSTDKRNGQLPDSQRDVLLSRAEPVASPARGRGSNLSLEVPARREDQSASIGQVAAGDLSLEAPELRLDRLSASACAGFHPRPRTARTPRAEHSLSTPATPRPAEVMRESSRSASMQRGASRQPPFEVGRLRPRRPASTSVSAGGVKHDCQSPLGGGATVAPGSGRRRKPSPSFSKAGLPISAAARWAMTPGDEPVATAGGSSFAGVVAERDALAAENMALRRLLQAEETLRPRTPPRPRARASSGKPPCSGRCSDDKTVRHRRGFR